MQNIWISTEAMMANTSDRLLSVFPNRRKIKVRIETILKDTHVPQFRDLRKPLLDALALTQTKTYHVRHKACGAAE